MREVPGPRAERELPRTSHGQELVHLEGVGNYAVSLTWQDGHSTGIYSFRLLRTLCPCDACGGEKTLRLLGGRRGRQPRGPRARGGRTDVHDLGVRGLQRRLDAVGHVVRRVRAHAAVEVRR